MDELYKEKKETCPVYKPASIQEEVYKTNEQKQQTYASKEICSFLFEQLKTHCDHPSEMVRPPFEEEKLPDKMLSFYSASQFQKDKQFMHRQQALLKAQKRKIPHATGYSLFLESEILAFQKEDEKETLPDNLSLLSQTEFSPTAFEPYFEKQELYPFAVKTLLHKRKRILSAIDFYKKEKRNTASVIDPSLTAKMETCIKLFPYYETCLEKHLACHGLSLTGKPLSKESFCKINAEQERKLSLKKYKKGLYSQKVIEDQELLKAVGQQLSFHEKAYLEECKKRFKKESKGLDFTFSIQELADDYWNIKQLFHNHQNNYLQNKSPIDQLFLDYMSVQKKQNKNGLHYQAIINTSKEYGESETGKRLSSLAEQNNPGSDISIRKKGAEENEIYANRYELLQDALHSLLAGRKCHRNTTALFLEKEYSLHFSQNGWG